MSARGSTHGAAGCLLSARELEVLTLVACGLSTEGIADELFVSPNTVRSHVRRIMDKLHARNRPHAVAIAFSNDEPAAPQHPGRTGTTEAMVTVAGQPRLAPMRPVRLDRDHARTTAAAQGRPDITE